MTICWMPALLGALQPIAAATPKAAVRYRRRLFVFGHMFIFPPFEVL
jgi:hypothetical protein